MVKIAQGIKKFVLWTYLNLNQVQRYKISLQRVKLMSNLVKICRGIKVVFWTYLNQNQVHFQNQLAKGRVAVEFGEYRPGNKEVVLWTVLNLKSGT